MFFLHSFSGLQLDIVGIVAILGEASTSRTSQISALSWHHVFPRLMPAPQALLKHEREKRLPTEKGTVVGAYSGNLSHELNLFCQLLHKRELEKNEVELVEVKKKPDKNDHPAYEIDHVGVLCAQSTLGTVVAAILVALSVHYNDGWALVATILLSFTSTLVGLASRWNLKLIADQPNKSRVGDIPDGDVVIYYPRQGAFRVVRCNEYVSRLYFTAEIAEPLLKDNAYRAMALSGTVTLIFGLICMGNSRPILQVSFAATYILLNVAYWMGSAMHIQRHWIHSYDVKIRKFDAPNPGQVSAASTVDLSRRFSHQELSSPKIRIREPKLDPDVEAKPGRRDSLRSRRTLSLRTLGRIDTPVPVPRVPKEVANFTSALWTTIALTGSIRWLQGTNIAPNNDVWEEWIRRAGEEARPKLVSGQEMLETKIVIKDSEAWVQLPQWPFQRVLNDLFRKDTNRKKGKRLQWPGFQDLYNLDPSLLPSRISEPFKQAAEAARKRVAMKTNRVEYSMETDVWIRDHTSYHPHGFDFAYSSSYLDPADSSSTDS